MTELAAEDAQPVDGPRPPITQRQVRHLAASAMLEESGMPRLVRLTLLASVALVAAFLVWAAVTHVSEVAVTTGEVVPSGRVRRVQHLEGGIVAEIAVRDGDVVDAGQTLLRLDGTRAAAELDQIRARQAALILERERLAAFGTGREPDFTVAGPGHDDLAETQRTIYRTAVAAREADREVLERQIAQREADLVVLDERQAALQQQSALLAEEMDMREHLYRENLSSKVVYLDIKRKVAQVRGDLAALLGERQRVQGALDEARSRLAALDTDLRREALTEMGRVTAELAEVHESLARLEDRVARLTMTAPVRGVVQGLSVNTIGGVVAPGDTLLEVVPLDAELVAETRISPQDIGHVHVGQDATVKVAAFNFARYGSIPGVLEDISASTFVDDQKRPFYRGTIRLERPYVGADPKRNRVLPGMTVQADIDTGDKTLLQYLLKPVYAATDVAFRER